MRNRLLALVLALVLPAAVAGAATARAIPDPPPDGQVFPTCDAMTTTYCISSFGVDPGDTGTFSAPPAGLEFQISLFQLWDPHDSLNANVVANGSTNISSLVPAGTAMHVEVNTGSWKPPAVMTDWVDPVSYTRSYDAATGWNLSFTFRSVRLTLADSDSCNFDNFCVAPTGVVDLPSRASFQVMSGLSQAQLDALDPASRAYNIGFWDRLTGVAFGVNAAGWSFPPAFDPATGSITLEVFAPHFREDGTTLNEGQATLIMPDAAVRDFWGADPDALAAAGSALVATRQDAGSSTVSTVTSTVTRVDGGIRIAVTGFHYSSPKIRIRPRRLLPAPAKVVFTAGAKGTHRVVAAIAGVRGAKRYQAQCTRGRAQRSAIRGARRFAVGGLAAGRWSCRARATAALGGRWTATRVVRVR